MDKRAISGGNLEPDRTYFTLDGRKKDGQRRTRYFYKFNHALRAMFRIVEPKQFTVTSTEPVRGRTRKLFARISGKRGFNIESFESVEGRPTMKDMGRFWHRIPRQDVNDIN